MDLWRWKLLADRYQREVADDDSPVCADADFDDVDGEQDILDVSECM